MGEQINIKDLREKAGLTQMELAEKSGIPRDRIAKWETRNAVPKADDFEKIMKVIGNGKNVPYTAKRRNLKNNKEDSLTFYEVGASAGNAHSAEILPVKKNEGVLHISDLFKGSQYAIRISGNSMTPSYPSGAIIGIREIEDKQITPGSVYVIEKGSDLWIKRLFYKDDNQDSGFYECVSDNTMKFENGSRVGKLCYPPFNISIDNVRKLFKVTGIYKPNELTVIN